jgi:polar amino acid transport system substrate-binding protein
MASYTRILSALFAVAVLASVPRARADELASIMAAKVIKAAVPQDFAPFGSVGLDMKPQGYDIDMAELIAKALGVKAELIPVTTANRIA